MFSMQIVDSDSFLTMPLSTQALYFHLNMRADDDGFVNNPRSIQRLIGASDDDCKLLIAKRFILTFESGVIVIKHWCINNYIRGDRKKDTLYPEEMALLKVKDNGAYTMSGNCQASDSQMSGKCLPSDGIGKDSIGKYSLVKESVGKERVGVQGEREPTPSHPETKNVDKSVENLMVGIHGNVQLTQKELAKLKLEYPDNWERMVDDLSAFLSTTDKPYDRHYDIITGWAGGNV
jgi:hypothetical protein